MTADAVHASRDIDDRQSVFDQIVERGHERVCFHHDSASGLRAIVAIHSTVLGNALGGTRRWCYASEADAIYDVLRLSKGMTWKAAVAGLPMGGAKSVILLPDRHHVATEAEARAMGRFVDTFGGAYIAAEDVGIDPQFIDWMALETSYAMGGDTVSHGGDPSPFTARGTFHAMRACLSHAGRGDSFDGVHVAIQGVGHVGRHLASLLREAGARVTVADIDDDRVRRTCDELGCEAVPAADVLTTECDVLAPCALGGVIDGSVITNLRCGIVCGAANNILDDPDEDAAALKSRGAIYGPDFVVNAGGLIELAGLYLGMTREELDTRHDAIHDTTLQVLADGASADSTYAAAIDIAKQRIAAGRPEQLHAP